MKVHFLLSPPVEKHPVVKVELKLNEDVESRRIEDEGHQRESQGDVFFHVPRLDHVEEDDVTSR